MRMACLIELVLLALLAIFLISNKISGRLGMKPVVMMSLLVVVLVTIGGVTYKITEYVFDSNQRKFFCEYLVPGMEKEQVKELLTRNDIRERDDYPDGDTWYIYGDDDSPWFVRNRGIWLSFYNDRYDSALMLAGFDRTKSISCGNNE